MPGPGSGLHRMSKSAIPWTIRIASQTSWRGGSRWVRAHGCTCDACARDGERCRTRDMTCAIKRSLSSLYGEEPLVYLSASEGGWECSDRTDGYLGDHDRIKYSMFRESSTPHTRADSRNATSDLPTSASLASACHRVLLSRPRESQVIYRALVCLAHSTCEWRPPDGTACTAVYPLCRPAHEATMMSLRASSRSYHALVASHHLLPIPLQCAQPLPARARHSVVRFHLAITKMGLRTDGEPTG